MQEASFALGGALGMKELQNPYESSRDAQTEAPKDDLDGSKYFFTVQRALGLDLGGRNKLFPYFIWGRLNVRNSPLKITSQQPTHIESPPSAPIAR